MNIKYKFLALAAMLAMTASSMAGPSATRIDMKRSSETFAFVNSEEGPVRYEIQPMKWTSEGLTPTKDIMVYPPVFELGGKDSQTIKVLSRVKPAEEQGTYRLIFKALAGSAFNVSVPLFVPSLIKEAKPNLEIIKQGEKLVIRNTGNVTERITQIFDSEGKKDALVYVLPKSETTIDAKGVVSLKGDAGSYRL